MALDSRESLMANALALPGRSDVVVAKKPRMQGSGSGSRQWSRPCRYSVQIVVPAFVAESGWEREPSRRIGWLIIISDKMHDDFLTPEIPPNAHLKLEAYKSLNLESLF